MQPTSESEGRSRRERLGLVVAFVASVLLLVGWFDQSAEATVEFDALTRLVIVSDAGPVEITERASASVVVTRFDSWVFSEPRFESFARGDEAMVRASCPGRFPCRSRLKAEVPAGTEVIVVASGGVVDVLAHSGVLSIYSSAAEGVVLGPIEGVADVTQEGGSLSGFSLALDRLAVRTDESVRVSFARSPQLVQVEADSDLVQVGVPQRFYRVEIETESPLVEIDVNQSSNANRGIEVDSNGPVQVVVSDG